MKEVPLKDQRSRANQYSGNGTMRPDGRMVCDTYLMQV
jgi:hypothetical protein